MRSSQPEVCIVM